MAKRPKTVADWVKSDPKEFIPTSDEIRAFRADVKIKLKRELERLANSREISRNRFYEEYAVDPTALMEETSFDAEVAQLNNAIQMGDTQAILRVQALEEARKKFLKQEAAYKKSRDNITKEHVKVRDRINSFDKRRVAKIKSVRDVEARKLKANHEYVELIEARVAKLEKYRGGLLAIEKYKTKIDWCATMIEELRDENQRLKRALVNANLVVVE